MATYGKTAEAPVARLPALTMNPDDLVEELKRLKVENQRQESLPPAPLALGNLIPDKEDLLRGLLHTREQNGRKGMIKQTYMGDKKRFSRAEWGELARSKWAH